MDAVRTASRSCAPIMRVISRLGSPASKRRQPLQGRCAAVAAVCLPRGRPRPRSAARRADCTFAFNTAIVHLKSQNLDTLNANVQPNRWIRRSSGHFERECAHSRSKCPEPLHIRVGFVHFPVLELHGWPLLTVMCTFAFALSRAMGHVGFSGARRCIAASRGRYPIVLKHMLQNACSIATIA